MVAQKNKKQFDVIMGVLSENKHHFLAVHEIGNSLKAKGIFYNDPGISACLRKPMAKGGVREMVYGQLRDNKRFKEWKAV